MAVVLAAPGRDLAGLADEIRRREPELDLRLWPELGAAGEIRLAVVWQQPPGFFQALTELAAVCSLGAGVEHLLADPELPPQLPVGRLAGPRLAADMAAYLVAQVFTHWRRLPGLVDAQARRQWAPWAPSRPPRVGLLGTGKMASPVIRAFQALETPLRAFNRSGAGPAGIRTESGREGLLALATWSDYLICLLPLTGRTRGILDGELFASMRPGSVVINVGRGAHLVEGDLLTALKAGRPGSAILDVFSAEPLPPGHPFWTHPAVQVTPHCASLTADSEAADLIIENYRRVTSGQRPLDEVDRSRGY